MGDLIFRSSRGLGFQHILQMVPILLATSYRGPHEVSLLQPADTSTWTLKVCKIMAFMAILCGLGLFVYILLGFR